MTVSSMGDLFSATVNARGLKQNKKRLAIFRYFKQQHYDIICLQETHLTKQDISIWEKQWGGTIIYVEVRTQSGRNDFDIIKKNVM